MSEETKVCAGGKEIRSNKKDRCLNCNDPITAENDSGWEMFTKDGVTTQPICIFCDSKEKGNYVKKVDVRTYQKNAVHKAIDASLNDFSDNFRKMIKASRKYPEEFLDDVLSFCAMFYHRGYPGEIACGVHGEELQEEMLKKWPKHWMDKIFEDVGKFGEEPDDSPN